MSPALLKPVEKFLKIISICRLIYITLMHRMWTLTIGKQQYSVFLTKIRPVSLESVEQFFKMIPISRFALHINAQSVNLQHSWTAVFSYSHQNWRMTLYYSYYAVLQKTWFLKNQVFLFFFLVIYFLFFLAETEERLLTNDTVLQLLCKGDKNMFNFLNQKFFYSFFCLMV
jgi:hypothetical protein